MRQQGRVTISATTKERGDFVGLDQHLDWHVVEAKGRSHKVSQATIDGAKAQAARIQSIDNHPPKTCVACVTDLSAAPIKVYLQDPPTGRDQPRRINVADFWTYYYGNIAAFIEQSPEKGRVDDLDDYSFGRFYPGLTPLEYPWMMSDLYIGLPKSVMLNPSVAPELMRAGKSFRSPYVGSDLIALAGRLPEWPDQMVRFS